jgi:hypothetical protein
VTSEVEELGRNLGSYSHEALQSKIDNIGKQLGRIRSDLSQDEADFVSGVLFREYQPKLPPEVFYQIVDRFEHSRSMIWEALPDDHTGTPDYYRLLPIEGRPNFVRDLRPYRNLLQDFSTNEHSDQDMPDRLQIPLYRSE